jgi:hypothetical protein
LKNKTAALRHVGTERVPGAVRLLFFLKWKYTDQQE